MAFVDFESINCLQFICINLRFKIRRKKELPSQRKKSKVKSHDLGGQFAAARDNHALKSRVQNVHRGMWCVARSVLLEPHVIGIHIIHFRSQEVAYHRSVALAVDGYDNARFVLEEVPMIPPDQNPHQVTNFLGMHLELVYLAWIGIVPNSTILLVHISIHSKMGLIAKDDLFGEI